MPKVGSKHFAYTTSGMKAAKAEAKKTGMPMEKKKMGKSHSYQMK